MDSCDLFSSLKKRIFLWTETPRMISLMSESGLSDWVNVEMQYFFLGLSQCGIHTANMCFCIVCWVNARKMRQHGHDFTIDWVNVETISPETDSMWKWFLPRMSQRWSLKMLSPNFCLRMLSQRRNCIYIYLLKARGPRVFTIFFIVYIEIV